VLHAPVMTEGDALWLTPTYYALQMHTPHIGASALPVDVTHGASMPGSENQISAVTATASVKDGKTAVTLINRHISEGASVTLAAPGTKSAGQALVLAADSPRAMNGLSAPDKVKPVALNVSANGANSWRIELPPASMATIQFS
jgi:alpha-N-arabinofuranosidase